VCDLNNVSVITDMHEAHIRGSSHLLREVIVNIIDNAINAMPEGGTISIHSQVKQSSPDGSDASSSEFSFTDTGVGIPPERLKTVCEPFNSTKEYGLGIGLTLCKRIIEQCKGSIAIESELGSGTTITLVFPYLP